MVDLPHRNSGWILKGRPPQPIITPIPHELNVDDDVHYLLQFRRIVADSESSIDPYTKEDVTCDNQRSRPVYRRDKISLP